MKTKNHLIQPSRADESAGKTPNIVVPLRSFAWGLPGLLFISLCTLSPSPAGGACNRWDVSGKWLMKQSNGINVSMDVRQSGTTLLGEASYNDQVKDDGLIGATADKINPLPKGVLPGLDSKKNRTVHGAITGSLEGNRFYVQITWHPTNSVGVYNGQIDGGTLRGYTNDLNVPSVKAKWSSSSPMKCAEVAGTNAAPPAASKTKVSPVAGSASGVNAWLGRWDTKTDQGGHFELIFQQVGPTLGGNSTLIGTYRDLNGNPKYNGQLRGTLSGNVLRYESSQSDIGTTGTGAFELSSSGKTISGTGVANGPTATAKYRWSGSR